MPLNTKDPAFFVAEVQAYRPAGNTGRARGHGTRPQGVAAPLTGALESTDIVRFSDMGYRTRQTDAGGIKVYPPTLDTAFELDRRVNLEPADQSIGYAFGALRINNRNRYYDNVVATRNVDGRPFSVRWARKAYEALRGLYLDPPLASLQLLYAGIARPWKLRDGYVELPLRDPSYWLERPYQSNQYAGTGGYQGTVDLKGKNIPRLRGGNAANPVRNITATLVDPVKLIYQYNDGPGAVINLYEGADNGILFQENVSDLNVGTTQSGRYRTDNARGYFQLGKAPSRVITLDAWGAFPQAGQLTTAASIALYMLTEDLSMPASLLDTASFTAMSAAYPYVCGWYFASDDTSDALSAVGLFLTSAGLRLLPTRAGTLKAWRMPVITDSSPSVDSFDASNILDLVVDDLPETLNPPPYRYRVGFARNHTIQTTDLDPDVTDMTRKLFLKEEYRFPRGWSSPTIAAAYRRPNDPEPWPSALLVEADAQAVADYSGSLLGRQRTLYALTVPLAYALSRDIGDTVGLRYNLGDLSNGRKGLIVGEQLRAQSSILQVFV